ncbi:VOC family protein [Arthrobacter agilis]|jgi:catechol 2,3-dioxygenase-like lactoylglutathione lyase family enzyme|uniref:VOC family protein n=1 Tax=Arthrobacter agilis TaxID=37921 RepID=UPI00277EB16B|nr:VOC family protein [Arthrobacter agilis]MDQ0734991.1 catechol 2,3-dioxygenase-like lactoylglutathione lyase family enzyme [Arthrobacter agilis]
MPETSLEWKLEVIVLPSSDIDRSIEFYRDSVGFVLDHDVSPVPGVRVVQFTPRGSSCSVVFTEGMGSGASAPISGLQLVVRDVESARLELLERGIDVEPVTRMGEGDAAAFIYFSDPDGNGWAVQEIRNRSDWLT